MTSMAGPGGRLGDTAGPGGRLGDTAGHAPDGELLAIGRVAELVGVSERTLRYYEEIGLVVPASHSPGRCRRYTDEDVQRVARIRELQEVMGYSLEEIHAILAADDRFDAIRIAYRRDQEPAEQVRLLEEAMTMVDEQRIRVWAKVERLNRILAELDARSARYHEVHADLTTSHQA
ncbi:MAG: MerR family transcriptional regulator [Acidimicrobiales bacterium]